MLYEPANLTKEEPGRLREEEMDRLTKEQKKMVAALVKEMTLEEKIGQMNQVSVSIVGGFDVPFEELIEMLTSGRISQEEFDRMMAAAEKDYHEDGIRAGKVGSVMLQEPRKVNELQRIAVEESRLGIPLLVGLDVIHGFRTVFPIPLAEACTFAPELFERTAQVAAKESRTQGVNWHFAPMVDIARDARWGRISESPGEDPYLGSVYAGAKVRGLQGDRSAPDNYVAACLKHYVAYGACEGGRDYNTVSMDRAVLYNVYLPPFEAGVRAGTATVMSAFNDLNGIPCTVNAFTLRQLLKGRFAFPGLVVSDANAIRECIEHGIAADEADAGTQAALAGIDMDMGTEIFSKTLEDAVENGRVPLSVIDEAVTRILSVKAWLGLFEHPYAEEAWMDRYETLPEAHLALAREAAEKAIVLLKNEGGVLPLKKEQKISLIGTLAADRAEVVGAWALSWREEDCVSIKDGFENIGAEYRYFPCGGPAGNASAAGGSAESGPIAGGSAESGSIGSGPATVGSPGGLNEAEIAEAAAWGDVIVAVVGETTSMSGEAASRADITLPGSQRELLARLLKSGKPVVAVLMNGRPLALDWEAEHLPAMVECWQLGIQMGNAVARVLFGDAAPQGKLSASFPRVSGQCPVYYNHPNTGRPGSGSKFTSRYLDAGWEPLYPFGYGLSYTSFSYQNLRAAQTEDAVEICAEVRNEGDRAGVETVQLYTRDVTASIVRPVKELKAFQKVALEPGECCSVSFRLEKDKLGFFLEDGSYTLEDGLFRFYLGGSSADCLAAELEITF